MGLFQDLKGSGHMMQFCIIKLVCCLGWFSAISFGQMEVGEAVSSSVSFPDLGLTFLVNLAFLYSSVIRGRFHLEIAAKYVFAILKSPTKLKNIEEYGGDDRNCFKLTTSREEQALSDCSVIMLARRNNRSMRQFVEYIANVYDLRVVIVQYFPLKSLPLTLQICNCAPDNVDRCRCIVFRGTENLITMLARRMPGTIKALSGSLYLLPCTGCLLCGCHGCNEGLLHHVLEGPGSLTEGDPVVEPPHVVCKALDDVPFKYFPCLCIPLFTKLDDEWTKLLIKSFKSKDHEAIGAKSDKYKYVSDALENYIAGSGEHYGEEIYTIYSFIMPTLGEIAINLALTFWFKVDGFSSALVARRAIGNYFVDESGKGLCAQVFVASAKVISNDDYTHVCQMFSFRPNCLNPCASGLIVGCVNLICFVSWVVLIALEGGANKWYHTHSAAPSQGRVSLIEIGILIALVIDFTELAGYWTALEISTPFYYSRHRKSILLTHGLMILKIVCLVSAFGVVEILGRVTDRKYVGSVTVRKFCGRWVYSVLHVLVWMQWGMGNYLMGLVLPQTDDVGRRYTNLNFGMVTYCSAFFLNTILAGVRTKWDWEYK